MENLKQILPRRGFSPFFNVFINQDVSGKGKYHWILFYDNKVLKGTK